jgi:ABC-2 type transport system permease protein
MNLLILPLFFLSSAFFPIADTGLPDFVEKISFANPLFYMVDGIRGSLTGMNNIFHPLVDLGVVFIICIVMLGIGSYFFSKTEV